MTRKHLKPFLLLLLPIAIYVGDGWFGVPDTDVCGQGPDTIYYTIPCVSEYCYDENGSKKVGERAGMWGKLESMQPEPSGWMLTYSHPVRGQTIDHVPACPSSSNTRVIPVED